MTVSLFSPKILAAVTAIMLLWTAPPAFATSDGSPDAARFSGNVQLGVMWSDSTGQLKVFDTNETTDDLSRSADRFDVFYPIVLFELRYRTDDHTTLHAGTPIDEYGIRLNAGVTHNWGTAGQLDASVFWSPMHQEWEDPYIAGRDRAETAVLDGGIELKYNRILGTAWQCRGIYHYIDVDNDLIGERFEALQRDGAQYTINIGYAIQIDPADKIIPAFDYTRGQMDGASNTYDSYRVILNYVRMTRRYMVNAYLGAGASQYAQEHPLYGQTRQEKSIGGFAFLTWFNPFAWQHTFFSLGAGAGYTDANIDFFDARTFSTLVSVGYSF